MTPDDWAEVSLIYLEGIKLGIATFSTELPSYEEWDSFYLKEHRYVAIIDDKVVGFTANSSTSVRAPYSGVVEVSIYISQAMKGRGIGTKMLNYAFEKSEQSGIWMMQSSILQINIPSIKVHEKCKFRIVGFREKIAKDINGVWQNTVIMERRSKLSRYSD